jgi:hypothetical protein
MSTVQRCEVFRARADAEPMHGEWTLPQGAKQPLTGRHWGDEF